MLKEVLNFESHSNSFPQSLLPSVLNAAFIPHAALNRGVPENLLGTMDHIGCANKQRQDFQ